MVNRSNFVFDSYALLGYLEDEPFAGWIQELLLEARAGRKRLFLHMIHLGEVYYITLRERGESDADIAYTRIKDLPLTLLDKIDEELLLEAASPKATFPISYADAFAAALAGLYDAALLTGDPEFRQLEEENLLSIHWLT